MVHADRGSLLYPCGQRSALSRVRPLPYKLAIVTSGKSGALVYNGEEFFTIKPSNATLKVLDTLGTGDSFLAGFITTYIGGKREFQEY